ncbi:MAG: SDR family oxidoreductase [Desulfobacterales bacterium]|nr:SDR family oxidoreductase [Desulfobacterales bacterium]MDP6683215.1 SDR family oxidoreductase [Desulfobacterales bacterium]MDP6806364.1 SDR family oxidoreductase [Desulfobacterales bacterium]
MFSQKWYVFRFSGCRYQTPGANTLIKSWGGKGIFVQCDVGVEEDVKYAIRKGIEAYQRLDVLFNNAGVLWRDRDRDVTRTDEVVWDGIMAINLKGTVWICKYAIPEMIDGGNCRRIMRRKHEKFLSASK